MALFLFSPGTKKFSECYNKTMFMIIRPTKKPVLGMRTTTDFSTTGGYTNVNGTWVPDPSGTVVANKLSIVNTRLNAKVSGSVLWFQSGSGSYSQFRIMQNTTVLYENPAGGGTGNVYNFLFPSLNLNAGDTLSLEVKSNWGLRTANISTGTFFKVE